MWTSFYKEKFNKLVRQGFEFQYSKPFLSAQKNRKRPFQCEKSDFQN